MLKIWGRINSINVQKVLWVLDALRLDYVREDAGLEFSVNRSTAYLEKNPNGRVPLLEDGDYQIWESHSICRYLCNSLGPDHVGAPVAEQLYPRNPRYRGQVDQWLDWTLWGISAPMVTVFRQRVRLAAEKRDGALIAQSEEESRTHLQVANERLSHSQFLAADHLTLADIALAPIVYRAAELSVFGDDLVALKGWMTRLRQEDGYMKWVSVPMS